MNKFLFLDCDSTLCAIEGVDELAALRGAEVEQQVIELTNQAMDGTVPITEVFGRRLDLIQPTSEMCAQVGQMYIDRLSPHAEEVITQLVREGWTPIIISGGFTPVIQPVADQLAIETLFAVDLDFDKDGNYLGFNRLSPTARNGGKPEIIEDFLKDKHPHQSVMMGDGISDLETQNKVDLFVGYGGVVSREAVQEGAKAFINDFSGLPQIMKRYLKNSS